MGNVVRRKQGLYSVDLNNYIKYRILESTEFYTLS